MAKCDLCGSDCKAQELVTLMDQYQAAGVRDVCPACERLANKLKSDMLAEIGPRMRAAISERKAASADASLPAVPGMRRILRALGIA